jgi:outer membrane protein assembly factor BamA
VALIFTQIVFPAISKYSLRTHPVCRALTATVLFFASLPALAQGISTKIFFTGAAPYSDADLSTVVGLHSGQLFTDNELQAGSQRLIDTGLFDSAALTATGKGSTRQARYTIKPTPDAKLLAPSFANFVWFTPAELDQALRKNVPLYRALLPDSGTFPDTVQALVQLLKDKAITATVSHTVVEPTTQHPFRTVSFRVDDPAIRIQTIHLSISGPPGAAAQLAPLLKETLNRSTGTPYNEGRADFTLEDRLLTPARDAGYAAASLDAPTCTVAPADDPSHGYVVTYTAKLISGETYKLSTINWTPTPVYAATDFTRDTKLHPGDLSSSKSLLETEHAILIAYRAQGYMDAYLAIVPSFETATHTVAYDIKAVPGDQYHLKSVTQVGLSPDVRQKFDSPWNLKTGEIYNETYVTEFLRHNIAQPPFNTYGASFQASSDPQTHLTDLTITFVSTSQHH